MKKYLIVIVGTALILLSCLQISASDQRVVRVGAFNYFPGIFKDNDGVVKGFYVDALADVAQRENIRFEYVFGSWSEGLDRIKTGEVDVLTSVAFTPERAQFLDYAKTPLLTVWGELYVPLSSEIDGIRAVQGKKIAVMKGDFNARHFIELVKKFDITCEFVEMPGFNDVFKAVAAKSVDAGVVNSTFGVAKQREYRLRSTGIVFNPFDIFFAVAKGRNSDLLQLLDKYLHQWRHEEDSPYNKARQKWSHGSNGAIPVIPVWLIITLAGLAVMALGTSSFVFLLRKQVQRKTSELREANKELIEQSGRMSSIINGTTDAVFIKDTKGRYIVVNDEVVRLFDRERSQIIGCDDTSFFSTEEARLLMESDLTIMNGGSVVTNEEFITTRGGKKTYLATKGPVYDENGELAGLFGIARDITAIKQADVMLRESKERYRLLVENLASGVVIHSLDSSVVFANPAALSMLGLTKEQIKGKTAIDPYWSFLREDWSILPPDEYPVAQVLSSGTALSDFVVGVRRPDLIEPVWVSCHAYPARDAEGKLQQVVVTFSDITGLKRAEESLSRRLVALTSPVENLTVTLDELFNIGELQRLQDDFAKATGVASIITYPDGTPLTSPSNFTRLCNDIIRKTEKGCAACYSSDAALGRYNPDGPNIQPCLSGGLWDAGAGITVGGQHIANWLIGQVRDETQTEEKMAAYAREIGVDEANFLEAFREVPSMPRQKFEQVAQTLYTLANQLSDTAYQNIQQARFINERKTAETLLQASEEQYRMLSNELQTILSTSPVGICLLKNRKVVRANVAFESIFGYEAGTTVDVDTVAFYSSRELYDEIGREAYPLLLKGLSYARDVLMSKKNGVPFWCNIAGHAVSPGNPEEGSIWIVQDITERKQSEEQLLSLSQRLQLATSSAHLGVWDWNVKENSMIWDDRMFELYGITQESFPNSIDAWLNGLHPEDKSAAIAESQAALNGEREFDAEFRVLHPDGIVRYLRGKGLVLRREDGTPERMIGINYDITEVKRAEEEKNRLETQLQQAQKMESVGRLAGGVAHDFNNMLSVILGHAELGLLKLPSSSPVCADLKEICKTADRSADLTRQLLAFARKQTVSPKVIDLNDTVTNMLKMLQRLIGEDIHLTWQPSPDPCQIKMDPSQIDQILANLCVNARDAIEDTGRITIETGICSVDAGYSVANPEAIPGEYVRLVVSDDGKGMDLNTQAHIFEPFYTTKEMGRGTGLGLATVYGAVKQNKGFINIYSEPGKGTTFSIYLPYFAQESICKQAEVDTQAVPRGQETILLVEDDAAILNITAFMLEKQGYTVLKADTPGAAIELARKHMGEIHLLMTDVIMPEMNGHDLAGSIRSLLPGVKLLFMSGYTADAIARHGVLDEGVHFLQKPFSLQIVATMVRKVLGS